MLLHQILVCSHGSTAFSHFCGSPALPTPLATPSRCFKRWILYLCLDSKCTFCRHLHYFSGFQYREVTRCGRPIAMVDTKWRALVKYHIRIYSSVKNLAAWYVFVYVLNGISPCCRYFWSPKAMRRYMMTTDPVMVTWGGYVSSYP